VLLLGTHDFIKYTLRRRGLAADILVGISVRVRARGEGRGLSEPLAAEWITSDRAGMDPP